MGKRPRIKLTVTDRRGKMGCHRGHHIGQTFDFDTERGELCPMAMHCAFPYIDILRYGGKKKEQQNFAVPMRIPSWYLRQRLWRKNKPFQFFVFAKV